MAVIIVQPIADVQRDYLAANLDMKAALTARGQGKFTVAVVCRGISFVLMREKP